MKKRWIVVNVVLAALLGVWLYWEYSVSLGKLLPEENWIRMDLELQSQSDMNGDIQFSEFPMEQILTQLDATTVSRAAEKRDLEDKSFRITLYKEEAWPTVIYVEPSGRISIAADMQFDDWKFYEGGETLYVYLTALTIDLPAIYPTLE